MNVALVVEVPPVAILPNTLVQSRLLRPLRYQTAGSIMVHTYCSTIYTQSHINFDHFVQAGKLAIERGWSINIGMYNKNTNHSIRISLNYTKDTSINRTLSSVPMPLIVYLTTSELRTSLYYSGHFTLAQM